MTYMENGGEGVIEPPNKLLKNSSIFPQTPYFSITPADFYIRAFIPRFIPLLHKGFPSPSRNGNPQLRRMQRLCYAN